MALTLKAQEGTLTVTIPVSEPAPALGLGFRRYTYSKSIHRKLAGWVAALEIEISEIAEGGDPETIASRKKNLASWRKKLEEYERRLAGF